MKKGIAISFLLLLTTSWFASYFTLKLIDRVVLENKLTSHELQESQKVVETLQLPEKTQLKKIDINNKLKLGYAVPFIVNYDDNNYYEVIDNPVSIEVETNVLKIVKVNEDEQGELVLILSSLFQFYYYDSPCNQLTNNFNLIGEGNIPYLQSAYQNLLSTVVPPPQS